MLMAPTELQNQDIAAINNGIRQLKTKDSGRSRFTRH